MESYSPAWYAVPVTFLRRLAALLVMDALLVAFFLATWLAAQAARDLLL